MSGGQAISSLAKEAHCTRPVAVHALLYAPLRSSPPPSLRPSVPPSLRP